MKRLLKLLLVIVVLLFMTGCDMFSFGTRSEEKYVIFSYNDSVASDYKCKIKDSKINCIVIEPENNELVFMGWYDEYDNRVDIEGDFEESIVLYPKFLTEEESKKEKLAAPKYTVAFNSNGGSGSIDKIEVEYEGQLHKLNNLPRREGYTFVGFFDNKDYTKGKRYYDENGESIRNYDKVNSATLYAGWEKDKEVVRSSSSTVQSSSSSSKKTGTPIQPNSSSKTTGISAKPSSSSPKTTGVSAKPSSSTLQRSSSSVRPSSSQTVFNYTVSFNLNGGSGTTPSSVTVTKGQEMPAIGATIPTKTGYTFMGWYDNKNWTKGNQYYTSENQSARNYDKTSNTTLYAGWEKIQGTETTYTIAFNANGGSGGQTAPVHAAYGKVMPEINTTAPTRTGYTFMGWYDNPYYTKGTQYYTNKGVSARNYDKNVAITLYAGWKANTFTVAYNGNGSTGGSTASQTCTYDAECKLKENGFTKTGYKFTGWKKSNTGNVMAAGASIKNAATSGTVTYYAQWATITYTVSFNANGGSGGQSATVQATYGKAMPKISTTAPTRTGYTFMGWYNNPDYTKGKQYYTNKGASSINYDKQEAITLYAGWKANTFTVSYNGNGSTSGSIASHTCTYDTECKLKDNEFKKTGYIFAGWKKSNTGSILSAGSSIKNAATGGTVTYYAQWTTVSYTISFSANGGTGGQTASVQAINGSPMPTIVATGPNRVGYTFMGWYDNANYTKGKQYYTDKCVSARNYDKKSALTLFAGWKANTFTVEYNGNGSTSGSTSIQTCTYDAACKLKENGFKKTGYVFAGWKKNNEGSIIPVATSIKNVVASGKVTYYAQWTASTYKVSFSANGGSGGQTASVQATYGQSMPTISTSVPTRTGYTFMGWYDNKDWTKGTQYYTSANQSSRSYDKTSNVTLYAGWEKKQSTISTYTVAFNANGGSGGQTAPVQATIGKAMPKISTTAPARTGYTFMGWYDNPDYTKGIQYYTNKGASARNYDKNSAITLYAGWKANTFTVSYNGNGNTSGSTASQTCTYDAECKLNANGFVKTGYTFVGWKKSNTGNVMVVGSSIKNAATSGTVTYYAQWTTATYNITFSLNGGAGTVPGNIRVTYGQTLSKLTTAAPTRAGYAFMGWYDNADYTKGKQYYKTDGKSTRNYDKYSDSTIYAGWKANTFTVSYNGNGSTGGKTASHTCTYDADCTIRENGFTKTGYIFTGWKKDNNGNIIAASSSIKNAASSGTVTYYAQWAASTYTISFSANGGTGGQTATVQAAYGQAMPSISSIVPTKAGYTFMGWYDNANYTKGKQYYTDKNVSARNYDKKAATTLYAGWKANTFTVVYNGNGSTSGSTASHTCTYDAVCKIKDNGFKKSGYVFAGWKKNNEGNVIAAGTSITNATTSGTVTYYAQWTTTTYKLTFNLNGGSGTAPSSVDIAYGQTMPAIGTTVPTKSNYNFMGWYDNKDWTKGTQYYTATNQSTRNYDKASNLTLYAGWEKKPAAVTTYTVAFNANGGAGGQTAPVQAVYKQAMPEINTVAPTRTGYTFMGWYNNTDYTKGTQYYTDKCVSAKNYDKKAAMTLYAGWRANTFTVSYNGNGSTGGSTASQTCTYDAECLLQANGFIKNGYVFTGWKKNNTGSVIAASSSIKNAVTSGTVTYYAQWATATYKISFSLNGGSGTIPGNISVTYGQTLAKLTTSVPVRTGYVFMGWYDNADYTKGTQYYKIDGTSTRSYNKYSDSTIYAGWKANTYTVSFDLNGGSGTTPGNVTVAYNNNMPKINTVSPTKDKYEFKGWYDNKDWTVGKIYYNPDGSSARPYDKMSNTTLYAGWRKADKIQIYYLSIKRYDGYLIRGNGTTIFIDGGDVDPGNKCVEFLKEMGVTRIDALIGSHLHDNHIDAHKAMIDNFDIGGVYYGDDPRTHKQRKTSTDASNTKELTDKIAAKNIPITILTPGLNAKIGNLTFDILAPINLVGSSNYNSLQMILKYGDHKFYFTGDSAKSVFNSVYEKYDHSVFSNITVFKHPHHGQEAVPDKFITAMSPKYVIIPNTTTGSGASGAYRKVGSTVYVLGDKLYNTKNIIGAGDNLRGYVLFETDGKNLTVVDKRK